MGSYCSAMVGIGITCAACLLLSAPYSLARPQEAPGGAPAPEAPPAVNSDLVDAERVEENRVDELNTEVSGAARADPPQCLSLAWSADGQTLFAGYSDNIIRVWQVSVAGSR